jgi:DNA-binding transcriptional MocR family regulator
MTPAEEAAFIALWNAGTETAAIARQLGLKATTAQSRARRLQERGLIRPRPRGRKYPSLRQRERHGDPPPPAAHPRVDIKQWTVRLSQALIDAVKAQAEAEGKEPSHLVEECLWHVLSERRTSTHVEEGGR